MKQDFQNSKRFFRGYASIFGVVDRAGDIILHGSLEPLFTSEVPLLFEHKREHKIGTVTKITQNKRGLYIEGETSWRELWGKIPLSIGFVPLQTHHNALGQRIISRFQLLEVSITARPANKWAYAELR